MDTTTVNAYVYIPGPDGRRFVGPSTVPVELGSFLGVLTMDHVFEATGKAHPGVYDAGRITHGTPRFFYRIAPVVVDGQLFNAVWCYANERPKLLPVDPRDPALQASREIQDDEDGVTPPQPFAYFLAWVD